ncbi:protein SAWADEE HOMEODOMAIN HOMOLOG 1-like isoform X2 [Rhododendron vialii]|uniref:protein SAWADEE HOMEODOMAIN HOMOLOG 1-like isoform X2 n=1 Tax=Rhododendron vialii TaxID=182163 RepID=UPI00265F8CC4|nr:protein SAWADEE HOMEODOMAIN HOMOLOG 1-like isoform X2 [Rhododendron vialii]
MDRLRPRERKVFSGFTTAEIAKMEKLHRESGEQSLDPVFCKRISKDFNRSKGRVGKPVVKWTEVQSWFHNRKQSDPLMDASSPNSLEKLSVAPEGPLNKVYKSPQVSNGETIPDLSELEFEAKSSKDGAWYDVDAFLAHRFLSSGEAEVRLRFIGFGSEEDEWINVKNAIRVRSLPLEHSECGKVKVGDQVLCFQERRDQAIYYDVHIVEIQRRVHDIRGCRCLFLIRYDHDNTEASSISISCYQTTISFISSSYISSCWLILSSVVTKCLTLILFYHLYFSRREFV